MHSLRNRLGELFILILFLYFKQCTDIVYLFDPHFPHTIHGKVNKDIHIPWQWYNSESRDLIVTYIYLYLCNQYIKKLVKTKIPTPDCLYLILHDIVCQCLNFKQCNWHQWYTVKSSNAFTSIKHHLHLKVNFFSCHNTSCELNLF